MTYQTVGYYIYKGMKIHIKVKPLGKTVMIGLFIKRKLFEETEVNLSELEYYVNSLKWLGKGKDNKFEFRISKKIINGYKSLNAL